MTEFTRLTMAPTKDEHDAVVARKGRPYTQDHMREARQVDDDSSSTALTPHERVIADSRRADRAGTTAQGGAMTNQGNDA